MGSGALKSVASTRRHTTISNMVSTYRNKNPKIYNSYGQFISKQLMVRMTYNKMYNPEKNCCRKYCMDNKFNNYLHKNKKKLRNIRYSG